MTTHTTGLDINAGPKADSLVAAVTARRRIPLTQLPTPLHRLDRLPFDRDLWIKRDDLVTVALGGNKIRKLEFLAADAVALGADSIVTVGSGQSNSARCSAAVASMLGLECHLVLGGAQPEEPSANLLLDHLFGAHLHFPGHDDWETLAANADILAGELRAVGRSPYQLPVGGSTPVGAVGFVTAYLELRQQLIERNLRPAAIVLAVSSGATQAGLELARAVFNDPTPILGIGVAKTAGDLHAETTELLKGCAELLQIDVTGLDYEVIVVDGYLGEAYATPTVGGVDALTELLRREGILLDPVYTAKGFHGALTLDRSTLEDGPIVFWHTGGTPSFFSPDHAQTHLAALHASQEDKELSNDLS